MSSTKDNSENVLVPAIGRTEPRTFQMPDIRFLSESEAERRKRIKAVEKIVLDVFKAAVQHLGREQATQLFADVSKRRSGRPPGPKSIDRDNKLIRMYDDAKKRSRSPKVAKIAEQFRLKYGAKSQKSVEKHLRRLLDKRTSRKKSADANRQQLREAREAHRARFGEYPISLLSMARSDKN